MTDEGVILVNMHYDIKSIYNQIYLDNEILERYKDVELNEEKNKGLAYHNFQHIKNVILMVDSILNQLNYKEDFIYKAKIACILHDVGALQGKDNHAYRSYEFSKRYFEENGIVFDNIDTVLEAIKIHSDEFNTDNIIALSLILADKIDIRKERISNEGKKVIGNRQYSHIIDSSLEISDKLLKINFITDGKIILRELNEYYFTKKIFKAIGSFANKLNLKYTILLDNEIWEI